MNDISHISIVPLIGGMTIAATQVLGKPPKLFVSDPAFKANEKFIWDYYPTVPRIEFDKVNEYADLVTTICPCAGLSMLNNSGKRGAYAPQNEWMYNTAETTLSNIKPKVMIGENAPGLYSHQGKPVADKLYEIGKKHGYSFSLIRTTSILHGIPQNRIRTFYFFWKSERSPIMNFRKKEQPSLVEFLKDSVDRPYQEYISSVHEDKLVRFLIDKGVDVSAGGSSMRILFKENLDKEFQEYIKDEPRYAKTVDHVRAKLSDKKSFWDSSPHFIDEASTHIGAITGRSMHAMLHPTEKRPFRYAEYMHLMGMPKDFMLDNPDKDMHKVTQNVPVGTAKDWIEECVKFINGELPFSNTDFLKQNNISLKNEEVKSTFSLF